MKQWSVKKRDGRLESGNVEKINKVCAYGCEGIDDVSESELAMAIAPHLRDGMTTREINEQIVSACKALVSSGRYHYDKVGGRISAFIVRKEAYGQFNPPSLFEIIARNTAIGRYDPDVIDFYSKNEWDVIDTFIDHGRDELLRLAGAEQMRRKYLIRHRKNKVIFESFQVPAVMVAAILEHGLKKDLDETEARTERLHRIKQTYDAYSTFDLSLPSPIMSGVRSVMKQFSSCVLIDSGDSLEEINNAASTIVRYVANKAGLGVNVGRNRGLGADIRNGEAIHTGLLPFIKKFTGDTKSCSQGGMRDGAVTFYFPMWHYEYPELVLLKSNTLPEEQTNRRADYGIQVNKFLIQRLLEKGKITLFSPGETPGLYDAFFSNQEEFARLYVKYENTDGIRKRTFDAAELWNTLVTQRSNSGRIYLHFVDTVNERTPFKVPIVQSNLCAEIALPSTPLGDDGSGEVSLCTLAAVNWGKIEKPEDFELPCRIAVRTIDAVLDYQEYQSPQAKRSTLHRRPLGIGIIGFAHFLAKKGLGYNIRSMAEIDRYAEAWAYYLTKASADLALERGPCPGWKETKYADGWTPNMTRSKMLDRLLPHQERMPWAALREQIQATGIRNSTLMALMPSETSSQISNETNGIEPPRRIVTGKGSKDVDIPMVIPDVDTLQLFYDFAWDQKGPEGYLHVTAVLQKYVDQAISINTTYNPLHYPGEMLSSEMLIRHIILAYQLGHKTLYYNNIYKPGEDDVEEAPGACEDGACKI